MYKLNIITFRNRNYSKVHHQKLNGLKDLSNDTSHDLHFPNFLCDAFRRVECWWWVERGGISKEWSFYVGLFKLCTSWRIPCIISDKITTLWNFLHLVFMCVAFIFLRCKNLCAPFCPFGTIAHFHEEKDYTVPRNALGVPLVIEKGNIGRNQAHFSVIKKKKHKTFK